MKYRIITDDGREILKSETYAGCEITGTPAMEFMKMKMENIIFLSRKYA